MTLLTHARRTTTWVLLTSILMPLMFATVAQAQSADSAILAQVRTTHVKPGMNATFEAFLKRLNALNKKHGTGMPTLVTRTRTGHNGYISITMMDAFADLKPGANWVDTFGAKESAELSRMIAESVAGGQVQTFNVRRDLGRQPSLTPRGADAFMTILITVKQNSGPAYEEALAKLVEASAKVAPNVRWVAYSPGMSSSNLYRVVVPIDWEDESVAMPIPERYTKAFGEKEGSKWAQQLSGATEKIETMMTINRPDLSSIPEE